MDGGEKFTLCCQTAGLQGAKGGSFADVTGKASNSGELKFCGEDGKESDIFLCLIIGVKRATRAASTTEKTSGSGSSGELNFFGEAGQQEINSYFYCQTAELQGAKGGSRADTTGKASSSGESKFCGEDGKESDIFDV